VIERNGKFAIKWYDELGVQKWKGGFASRELATQTLAAIINDVETPAAKEATGEPGARTGELFDQWIEKRMANQEVHRSARDERNRWNAYLKRRLARVPIDQVTSAMLVSLIQELRERLAPNTVHNALRTLSSFYTDMIDLGEATVNPVRMIPKKVRRSYLKRMKVDEPFVESMTDVAAIGSQLWDVKRRPDIATAYAIGALAGLRTGEIIGLEWPDVDFRRGIIHVRRQVRHGKIGPLKDGNEREVGIQKGLLRILVAYKRHAGGRGVLFPPTAEGRGGTKRTAAAHIGSNTLRGYLAESMKELKLKRLTWYQATRHTFASHYMMAGGDLAKLKDEMGHADVTTTQIYAKLSPNYRTERDRSLLELPPVESKGRVLAFPGAISSKLVAGGRKAKIARKVRSRSN